MNKLLIILIVCITSSCSTEDEVSTDKYIFLADTWTYKITNDNCENISANGTLKFNIDGFRITYFKSSKATGQFLNHVTCDLSFSSSQRYFGSSRTIQQNWVGFSQMIPGFDDGEIGHNSTTTTAIRFSDKSIKLKKVLSDSSTTILEFSSDGGLFQ